MFHNTFVDRSFIASRIFQEKVMACIAMLMFAFLVIHSQMIESIAKPVSDCSRANFEKAYDKERNKNASDWAKEKDFWIGTCSQRVPSCDKNFKTAGDLLNIRINVNVNNISPNSELFIVGVVTQQKDCFGYLLQISSVINGSLLTDMETIKMKEELVSTEIKFLMKYNFHVSFNVTEIPSGRQMGLVTILPGYCESMVSVHVKDFCQKSTNTNITIELARAISREGCEKQKQNVELSKPIAINKAINDQYCPLSTSMVKVRDIGKTDENHVLIAIVSGVLVTVVAVLAGCVWRLYKKKYHFVYGEEQKEEHNKFILDGKDAANEKWNFKQQDDGVKVDIGGNDDETHRMKKKRTTPPTIMLLSRPGCELMDTLLRDLAFILKANGILVNFSLLEQSELDAAGGISSFLQRNIDACDYILIMFSGQSTQVGGVLNAHKPFEFALKVITGLMYHRHETSRYVTMYLDPFKTAMHYIPSVFHATQNYGYQIPDDLEKLIEFLSDGLLTDEQHRQQELKNQLFVKRMKRTVKKLRSDHHDGCHGTKCFKGKSFPSVSNLSSIWATTIPSRASSTHDVCVIDDPAALIQQQQRNLDIDLGETNHRLLIEQWATSCPS